MSEDLEKNAEDIIQDLSKRINSKSDMVKGWGEAFRVVFVDADIGYWIKVSMDGTIEKIEKGSPKVVKAKKAVASLVTTTETMAGVLDKSIDGGGAIRSGAIKIEGSYDALIKIAPAIA